MRTPSQGWRPRACLPASERLVFEMWVDMEQHFAQINRRFRDMAINTEHLRDDLNKVRDGWASLVAERDQYKAALEQADARQAQAVADALAADNAVDQAAVDEADALIHDLVNRAEEPAPVEENPAEEPAPVDEAPADGSGEQV